MRKFLVPVDGSEMAERAAAHAAELAAAMPGTRVLLLNVQPALAHPQPGGLLNATVQAELRGLGEQAALGARALLDRQGVIYEFDVVFGPPAEVIVRMAREKACTGIVIGSRGMGEFRSSMLGSTTHQVIERADVPVTVVK